MSDNIIKENLDKIIARTFGNYSKYIIQDRALPDVRDGLKPVQRRIIYAMATSKIFYNTQYKKSARVVGEVIGKYHPHGDSSVYEAVVRLSQEWKMNIPLIEMHGNKGSIDGDSAAAMRYTEVRLSKISNYLIQGMNNGTVNFINNFDDNEKEPTVFPSRFPNILVNGSIGIAAGYSTNIPPHNFNEVLNSCIYRIKNPMSELKEVLSFIKGPDFPTYGEIVDTTELEDIYKTGRGKVKIRSKVKLDKNLNQIIVTSIPFEVNKLELVKSINELVFLGKVPGLKDATDHTDRSGLKIVIQLKPNSNSQSILHYLYKVTDLQKNYNYNMVAISHNKPKQMGILEILDSYISHQVEVYTREFNDELKNSLARLEIVEGLIKVVDIIDEVIALIRSSKNKKESKEKIKKKFKFSDAQAEAIVTLRLYRLASTDINMLSNEESELSNRIEWLNSTLNDELKLREYISSILEEINSDFHSPRKTSINNSAVSIDVNSDDLIKEEKRYVFVSRKGYIKKMSTKSYTEEVKEKINNLYEIKSDDVLISHTDIPVSNLHNLNIFTNKGRYISIPIHKIKTSKIKDMGVNVNEFSPLEKNEEIIKIMTSNTFLIDYQLISSTHSGYVKKSDMSLLESARKSKFMTYAKLSNEEDFITNVNFLSNNDEGRVLVTTRLGYYVNYPLDLVPSVGLKSKGVIAIKITDKDSLASLTSYKSVNTDKLKIGIFSEGGKYKRIRLDELSLDESRNKKGKLISRFVKTNPNYILKTVLIKSNSDKVNILNSKGEWQIHKLNNTEISSTSTGMSSVFKTTLTYVHKEETLTEKKILPSSEKNIKKYIKKVNKEAFDDGIIEKDESLKVSNLQINSSEFTSKLIDIQENEDDSVAENQTYLIKKSSTKDNKGKLENEMTLEIDISDLID